MTAKRVAVPVADYDRTLARAEYADARAKSLVDSLKELVAQLERVQGYSTYAQQADLRHARALIVECGE